MRSERDSQLQKIWRDAFRALGIGGLTDEDAAQQSLGKITFGARSPERLDSGDERKNVFRGKQAASKALENGQIFSALQALDDPEINKNVEVVRKWLGGSGDTAGATVGTLLERLFGKDTFTKFIDRDFPRDDDAKASVEPQPPKQTALPPGPPAVGQMGEQPGPAGPNPPPPQPAGAAMGMW